MYSTRAVASIVLVVLASACAERATSPEPSGASGTQRDVYEATGTVLESDEHGPELCLGIVLESLPPQCGGIPLGEWDWDAVDGEERATGTVWGDYRLTGVYDGDTFTVSDVEAPQRDEPAGDPIDTPCPKPAEGWTSVDPGRASEEDVNRAARQLRGEPDFGGLWVDTEEGSGTILNVSFTGSLDRHERDLREVWGGPLCLVERDGTYAELREIQRGLEGEDGVDALWSSIDVVDGTVEIGVTVLDGDTKAELDEKYGEGVVELEPRLHPVE